MAPSPVSGTGPSALSSNAVPPTADAEAGGTPSGTCNRRTHACGEARPARARKGWKHARRGRARPGRGDPAQACPVPRPRVRADDCGWVGRQHSIGSPTWGAAAGREQHRLVPRPPVKALGDGQARLMAHGVSEQRAVSGEDVLDHGPQPLAGSAGAVGRGLAGGDDGTAAPGVTITPPCAPFTAPPGGCERAWPVSLSRPSRKHEGASGGEGTGRPPAL